MKVSAKNLDDKGRFRCKTVSFRMSPEENDMLDRFVKISGYTKQDYLISRALQRDIVVNGNPRIYKALRNQMIEILEELRRLEAVSTENDELLVIVAQVSDTVCGLSK